MWKKKYYLIELETVKDENVNIHHLVCESSGSLMISDIIKNLDVDEWKLISSTELDPDDARRLVDILDGKDPDK